jgi:glucose-6-phosphate isomerase
VLDSLDVARVRDDLEWAQAHRASLIVVSKSGRTIEVQTLLAALAGGDLGPRFFVSDPGPKQMDALVGEHVRFEMPAEVGGRYSVFTAVGQVPMRAAGLDPHALLRGATAEIAGLRADSDHLLAPLWWRASHPAAASVVWSYDEALGDWVVWLQQLECESLGRTRSSDRVGELVVPLRGPADQHSVAQLLLDGPADKRVTVLDFASEDAPDPLREVSRLRRAARDATFDAQSLPAARMLVRDDTLETLGALMLDGMLSTVLLADHMGVDPYGQPAVEQIKKRVVARLSGSQGS